METEMKKLILFSVLIYCAGSVESNQSPKGLFVFGDSYVDTGNLNKTADCWHTPYGRTFPGKPSGRFSDGKVLTDFAVVYTIDKFTHTVLYVFPDTILIAVSYFKISSPVPYEQRNNYPNKVPLGMNFAYGGSGVFDTGNGLPSATIQIDHLQRLIEDGVYSAQQLTSSVVLFSVAGNDYGYYILKHGKGFQGLLSFARSVIKQLSKDLERLYKMGLLKIAVTGLEPLGCLPSQTTSNSYKYCNETGNQLSVFHNILLEKAVKKLKTDLPHANFVILNQYSAFMSILHPTHDASVSCGGKDAEGNALYSVCSKAESAFFWDGAHPTQAGWRALMNYFNSSFRALEL
eukprot:Gb_40027 [translate_table: standard]